MVIRTIETKFYCFRQNNSGGAFDISDAKGIGVVVYVEALNGAHAERRAEEIGIYFNGVSDGVDCPCPCCGDRWDTLYLEGDAQPCPDPQHDFGWHDTVYVHHLDGHIERIKESAALAKASGRLSSGGINNAVRIR